METNLLIVSPPDGLDFCAAGRRRSAAAVSRAAEERQQDEATAARLEAAGFDPWQGDDEVTVVDLATQGERAESRGRTLRRWPVYYATVRREQREAAAQIAAFVEDERAAGRAVRILHLRIRPTGPVEVGCLREHHREQSRRISGRLAYVANATGGKIVALAWGAHHKPLRGGAVIDWHAHVAVLVRPGADLRWLLSYFGGPDPDPARVWIGTRDRAEDPEALVVYLREGTARYVTNFETADFLAEYVAQVAGLHRYQALGPLRAHVSRVRAAGLQARRDPEDGRVVLSPPPRRPAHRPVWRAAGPAALAVRLAWIGDELRPAVLVRGWRGDWTDLARYDLDAAVIAARAAIHHRSSTYSADTPESDRTKSACASTQTQTPTPPPTDAVSAEDHAPRRPAQAGNSRLERVYPSNTTT
ncbi:hypothetical protein MCW82_19490 [Azospirillum doebereinerae]|uniref:hypothetical protein n=1 Tax=Azospirillum doebereinerae TaxID=92933 RepID=UPI001EE58028|nr:hypothetical protein [Azospirillum doebereinerae]MCG5241967.1 hypothetical protein [Azospirillum doebereinerae]